MCLFDLLLAKKLGGGSAPAPVLQEITKTYTANGSDTIEPGEGYDGIASVAVTVAIPTETKSPAYTANGSYTVTPSSGKYISSVSVTVAIPEYDGTVVTPS